MTKKSNPNNKLSQKLDAYTVGEYLNTEEFLTKKEKRSFEQVEKYVSKNRDETLQDMTKRKSERWDEDNFDYNSLVDEFTNWEEKYVNLKLEKMITSVNANSKSNTNWSQIKTIITYLIYLMIIGGAVLLLAMQNGIL